MRPLASVTLFDSGTECDREAAKCAKRTRRKDRVYLPLLPCLLAPLVGVSPVCGSIRLLLRVLFASFAASRSFSRFGHRRAMKRSDVGHASAGPRSIISTGRRSGWG